MNRDGWTVEFFCDDVFLYDSNAAIRTDTRKQNKINIYFCLILMTATARCLSCIVNDTEPYLHESDSLLADILNSVNID